MSNNYFEKNALFSRIINSLIVYEDWKFKEDNMLKAQVGNRHAIGAVEFRLKCLETDQEGIQVDDEGVEYSVNRYGVTINNMLHPVEKLDCDLVSKMKRKKEVAEKKAASAA